MPERIGTQIHTFIVANAWIMPFDAKDIRKNKPSPSTPKSTDNTRSRLINGDERSSNSFLQPKVTGTNTLQKKPASKPPPKKTKVTLWFYSGNSDFGLQRGTYKAIQAVRFINTRIYKIVTVNKSSDFYSYLNNLEKDKSFRKKYEIDRIVITGHARDLPIKFQLRNALDTKISKSIKSIMNPNLEVILEVCSMAGFTTTVNRVAKKLYQRLGATTVRSFYTNVDDSFSFRKGFVIAPENYSRQPKNKIIKTHTFSPKGKMKITDSGYEKFIIK